jgi:hypothetical protein
MKVQGPTIPNQSPRLGIGLAKVETPELTLPLDNLVVGESQSVWQGLLQRAGKGALGGAIGSVPAAGVGYLVALMGGIPGAVVGAVLGAGVGYVAGRELYEAAKRVENPNRTQQLMLKCGKAAPYVWAAWDGIECAAAGAVSPLLAAAIFAKKGATAGATIAALRA